MTQDDFGTLAASLQSGISSLRQQVEILQSQVRDIRALVGPFGVPMPDGTLLVQTLYGNKYLIDPLDLIIAPNLIVYRQWEADLSKFLHAAATPDTTFVDVGANFGYFTCLLGSKIGNRNNGRVFAVEPNPAMVSLLRKNVAINWSMAPIVIEQCAAGEVEGAIDFAIPKNRASNASLTVTPINDPSVDVLKVEMKSLDSIIPYNTAVDLMKIDVEGHEYTALKGARRLIAQSPNIKIVIEWSPGQFKDAGYSPIQLLELFQSLGLTMFRIPQDYRVENLKENMLSADELMSSSAYANIVLCH